MGFVTGERRGWAQLQIQGKGKFIAKVQDEEESLGSPHIS